MSEAYFFDGSNEGQEKDVLAIDDNLSPIERINKYVNSEVILHKLHLVRELTDLAQQMGYEDTKKTLRPILSKLLSDGEPVIRQTLVEQLPGIAKLLLQEGGNSEDALEQVLKTLLPMVKTALVDSNPQVRGAASESLVNVALALKPNHIEEHILPIVQNLANDSREDEHRLASAELLPKILPPLPQATRLHLVLTEIPKLSEDPFFRIRRATAAHLGEICKLLNTEEATKQILDVFLALSQDDIWAVRKACVDSLVQISECVPAATRLEKLVSVFDSFINDSSRWVKSAAMQNIGPFIATFPGPDVPSPLVQYFLQMVPSEENQKGDSDTTYYAAYSFPAVVLTLGNSRWSELRNVYAALTKDLQWKVRRTLAYSVHEVAKILGTELTEKYLQSAFNMFLGDIDQVREGVVAEMAQFLSVLSEPKRQDYIPVFQDILRDFLNWRSRKMLSKQIGILAKLYNKDIVRHTLLPIFLQLLQDPVFNVRKAAVKQVGLLLSYMPPGSEVREEFINTLQSISKKKSCIDRQVYALICEDLVDYVDAEVFKSKFLDSLIEFSGDKVPNVRLIVSRALSQKLLPHEEFGQLESVRQSLEKLKKDKDRDVAYFAQLPPGSITYTPVAPSSTPHLSAHL